MKRKIFVIMNLSLVSSFVILGFNVISPVLPQYALSFSIPVAAAGWAISAFALARMLADIPAGILADRFGRKQNMVLGLVLIAFSSAVAGMAPSYAWLVVGRIMQGIGSALYVTSATTWVVRISGGEQRGRFMSLYSGFIFLGTCFGPSIGGYAAVNFGLNAPFFVYGGFAVLGLLATLPLKETVTHTEDRPAPMRWKDVQQVIMNPSFLLVNSSVFALFFLRAGVRSTLVPLYAAINLGLSEDKIGIALTVAAIVTSVFVFPTGWFSDRVGRKAPVMACMFMSAFAVLLIPSQDSLGGLIGIMALYGFATGLQGSIAAWPADVAPQDKLGTAMGVYRLIGDIGMVVGPLAITYTVGYSGDSELSLVPFLIPAAVAATAGFLLIGAKDPAAKKGHTGS